MIIIIIIALLVTYLSRQPIDWYRNKISTLYYTVYVLYILYLNSN